MAPDKSAENKALVARAFDALNERDREAFAEIHSDDVVLHDHDEENRGLDAAIAHECGGEPPYSDGAARPRVRPRGEVSPVGPA